MCDINKITKRKSVIVYKVIRKVGSTYYSYFAGTKIKLGTVIPQTLDDVRRFGSCNDYVHDRTAISPSILFNPEIVNMITGFAKLQDAEMLRNDDCLGKDSLRTLKVKLSGIIKQGTTARIATWLLPSDHITFAGTIVDSFEEVKR